MTISINLQKNERRQVSAPSNEWRNFDRWGYENYAGNKSVAARAALIKASCNFDAQFAGMIPLRKDGTYNHEEKIRLIREFVSNKLDNGMNCFVDFRHFFQASEYFSEDISPYSSEGFEKYHIFISDICIDLECFKVRVGSEIVDEGKNNIVNLTVKNKGVVFFK